MQGIISPVVVQMKWSVFSIIGQNMHFGFVHFLLEGLVRSPNEAVQMGYFGGAFRLVSEQLKEIWLLVLLKKSRIEVCL